MGQICPIASLPGRGYAKTLAEFENQTMAGPFHSFQEVADQLNCNPEFVTNHLRSDFSISPIESAERGFAISLNWLKKAANDY